MQNGKPFEVGKYIWGKKNGKWSFYNERGNKIREQNFKNDVAEGKFTEFYASGKKQVEGSYRNRLKDGTWSYWDRNGKLLYQVVFKNGKEIKTNKNFPKIKENLNGSLTQLVRVIFILQ